MTPAPHPGPLHPVWDDIDPAVLRPTPADIEGTRLRLLLHWRPGQLLAELSDCPAHERRTIAAAVLGHVLGELARIEGDPAVIDRTVRIAHAVYRKQQPGSIP